VLQDPGSYSLPECIACTAGSRHYLTCGNCLSGSFLMQYGDAATAALHVGIEALEWPDSESVHKALVFCSAVANVATYSYQLQEVVGKDMFSSAIRALMLESNASAQAELVGLLRDIYLRLGSPQSTPHQVNFYVLS
jgi:exportin-5